MRRPEFGVEGEERERFMEEVRESYGERGRVGDDGGRSRAAHGGLGAAVRPEKKREAEEREKTEGGSERIRGFSPIYNCSNYFRLSEIFSLKRKGNLPRHEAFSLKRNPFA